eukprot:357182-Chlamydomonas_euryale.AAC.1
MLPRTPRPTLCTLASYLRQARAPTAGERADPVRSIRLAEAELSRVVMSHTHTHTHTHHTNRIPFRDSIPFRDNKGSPPGSTTSPGAQGSIDAGPYVLLVPTARSDSHTTPEMRLLHTKSSRPHTRAVAVEAPAHVRHRPMAMQPNIQNPGKPP